MTKYIILLAFLPLWLNSQVNINGDVHVSTNGDPLNSHAVLGLYSDTATIALPNLSTLERDALLIPQTGMLIYNKDDRKYQGYDMDQNSSTTVSCCNTAQLVVGSFDEMNGIILLAPQTGPIENIRLRYFFNGSTSDSIRLVIASNCSVGNETILGYTNKVPAVSGWNTYVPDSNILLNSGDIIYIWPEDINESLIRLRYESGSGNNSNIAIFSRTTCASTGANDVFIELNQTVTSEGWIDLH